MLLKDRLHPVRGHAAVPDSIRPDEQDGPFGANAKAIGLAAQHDAFLALGILQVQGANTLLESLPAGGANRWVAALRFGWGRAEQQVMADHAATAAIDIRWVPRSTFSRTARRAH